MSIHFPGVELSIDPSAGQWIRSELELWLRHGGEAHASQVIPSRYDAYARIFHPAGTDDRSVPWHEVAAWSGRSVHAEMQWKTIRTPAPLSSQSAAAPWPHLRRPDQGNLGRDRAVALARLLGGFTTTPRSAWFALWEGCGLLHDDARAVLGSQPAGWWHRLSAARKDARRRRSLRDGFAAIPKLHCEHRSYLVYRGPLESVDAFHDGSRPSSYQSPNLWWPDDRAWCVATEIDFDSTLVGADRTTIDAVLDAPGFEAIEITPQTRLDSEVGRPGEDQPVDTTPDHGADAAPH